MLRVACARKTAPAVGMRGRDRHDPVRDTLRILPDRSIEGTAGTPEFETGPQYRVLRLFLKQDTPVGRLAIGEAARLNSVRTVLPLGPEPVLLCLLWF